MKQNQSLILVVLLLLLNLALSGYLYLQLQQNKQDTENGSVALGNALTTQLTDIINLYNIEAATSCPTVVARLDSTKSAFDWLYAGKDDSFEATVQYLRDVNQNNPGFVAVLDHIEECFVE